MQLFPKTKNFIRSRYIKVRGRLSASRINGDIHQIPIIINNYNRLTTLQQLIDSLKSRGYHNIYILDNKSTYPPLLDWYQSAPCEVIYLPANLGFKALWKHKPTRKRFCKDFYIYTDSDIVLDGSCPDDLIQKMYHLMVHKYLYAFKIGPSLRIDDLPDHYARKEEVIKWESRFFKRYLVEDNLYRAPIDTTFALYRPHIGLSRRSYLESYRMGSPYVVKHLPWYENTASLTDEERYYKDHCVHVTAWSKK